MRRVAMATVIGAMIIVSQSADAGQPWTNVSAQVQATLQAGGQIMTKTSIWPYFVANSITNGNPFPDVGTFQAYGPDPGDCVVGFVPTQGEICANYRFIVSSPLAAGLSSSAAMFYWFDLNAAQYQLETGATYPKGTCFGIPYLLEIDSAGVRHLTRATGDKMGSLRKRSIPGGGINVVGISATMSEERSFGIGDKTATMAWFALLAGGNTAYQQGGSTMKILIKLSPPDSAAPTSFTFGGVGSPLQSVFVLQSLGNQETYKFADGTTTGVFLQYP